MNNTATRIREAAPARQVDDAGSGSPRVLAGLVLDTLEMLGDGGDGGLEPSAAFALRALWERGYQGESIRDARVTNEAPDSPATAMLGPALSVTVAGRSAPYPLMFSGPHWRLQVNPWRGVSRFILNAVYLASAPRSEVVLECERVSWFLYGANVWRISRIDVAADCVGLDLPSFARLDECVTRSHLARVYAEGAEFSEVESARLVQRHARIETVTLGSASSALQVCIYDKIREMKSSGKEWQADSLRERGWDGVEGVTRVEARFRARALDEFPAINLRSISMLLKFDAIAPQLWSYATTRAVRYVTPSDTDTNRARWELRDDWRTVSEAGTVAPIRVRVVTEAAKEERRKRASRSIIRGLVLLASEHESTARLADRMLEASLEASQQPEVVLAAVVLQAAGELLGARALGERDRGERVGILREMVRARRRWVAWADNPALAISG